MYGTNKGKIAYRCVNISSHHKQDLECLFWIDLKLSLLFSLMKLQQEIYILQLELRFDWACERWLNDQNCLIMLIQ